MRHLLRALVCLLAISCFSGCTAKVSQDAEEAVSAYNDFIDALRACGQDPVYQKKPDKQECDKMKIFNALDFQSRNLYLEAYTSLQRMDRIIETYFDSIEHKDMKLRTGTFVLTNETEPITDYEALFRHLFNPEKIVFNESTNSGLQFRKDEVIDKNTVIIYTYQKNQTFKMIREDDGVWRTSGLIDFISDSLDPIFSSETAMKEYAKGNFEAELNRRATVLKYFLVQVGTQKRLLIEMQKQQAAAQVPEQAAN